MWDVVTVGVQHVEGYIKKVELRVATVAHVLLPACVALSSGQETPTVSAVSLTANKFPGGGGLAGSVCLCE